MTDLVGGEEQNASRCGPLDRTGVLGRVQAAAGFAGGCWRSQPGLGLRLAWWAGVALRGLRRRSAGEARMLRIYSDMLDWLEELGGLIDRIASRDPDLARQLRRASRSVVLNTAEAMDARGRNKSAKYTIALSEMRESCAALEVSVRLRYIEPLEAGFADRSQKIIGTLYRLAHPRRR
jgi:four helix bundle protein